MNYLRFGILLLFIVSCKNETAVNFPDQKEIYMPIPLNKEKLDSMTLWVNNIKDGDSFVGIDKDFTEHEVRMIYIDAPERFQPYSIVAKQFTADLIFQDSVKIYYYSKDDYGRMLSVVVNSEDEVVNEELLKNGLAWFFSRYSKDEKYKHWQDSAQINEIGLFSEPDPIAPWDWRHQRH